MKIHVRTEQIDLFDGNEHCQMLQISDVHTRFSNKKFEQLIAIATNLEPDVVLLTGDYYDTPKGARLFKSFLEKLASSYPTFWIQGNHDTLYGDKYLRMIKQNSAAFCVDDQLANWTSVQGFEYDFMTLEQTSIPQKKKASILLHHNPEQLKAKDLSAFDFTLSGHLHGTQYVLGRTKEGRAIPGNIMYRYCFDRKETQGTTMIISKGIDDTIPGRFNCKREMVLVEVS
jgi:predicted MPP superfamily phosphohydrolase